MNHNLSLSSFILPITSPKRYLTIDRTSDVTMSFNVKRPYVPVGCHYR